MNNFGDGSAFFHPRFGDLTRLDAVMMYKRQGKGYEVLGEDDNMFIHLTITGRCYAGCKDCINRTITFAHSTSPNARNNFYEAKPERDAALILQLARRCRDRTITVCFYGGEPFLAPEIMEQVRVVLSRSEIRNRVRYLVYTNGELLIEVGERFPELMENLWLYAVSIDGNQEQHNRVRLGTNLAKIIENLRWLKPRYQGKVLFWSTLREEQSLLNCFEEFLRLYQEELVDYFFWHWAEKYDPFEDFPAYVDKYDRELRAVMQRYVERLDKGELLPIVHINELILYLITGKERGHTACGVELAENFDIMHGEVYACTDLPPTLARIGVETRENLKSLVAYKDWLGCVRCGVHPYCGGRCPVQAAIGSQIRTRQYCQLMRLHVGIVQERIEDIIAILERRRITPQHLYDHSAFLARYTDVVP